jgi:hypothetical protein
VLCHSILDGVGLEFQTAVSVVISVAIVFLFLLFGVTKLSELYNLVIDLRVFEC